MADNNEKILDIKGKSEDDFEKNITYISAGTLVLSLTFLEKVVSLKEASYIWALKWSWICLAVTLLVNLASHQLASWFGDLAYLEVSRSDPKHVQKVNGRNKIMRSINLFTILSLMLGISFLIYFSTKNAYKMANLSNQDNKEQQLHKESTNDLIKGRTYTPVVPSGNSGSTQTGTSTNNGTNNGNKQDSTNTQKKG